MSLVETQAPPRRATPAPVEAPRAITFQPCIYDRVLELLPDDRSAAILDVGAGQGFFTRQLTDAGYTQVEACDYLEEEFRCPEVPFRQADLSVGLPYPDDHFDLVVSIEVVEHIENHFVFLRELVRVTKPGGRVIVTTPNVMSLSSRWHFFLFGYDDCAPLPINPHCEQYFLQHINPISLAMLLFHFERYGAEVVDVTTNRMRKGSRIAGIVLKPILRWALRRRLASPRHAERAEASAVHLRWVLSDANLLGRITICVAEKR
ncbi:MAG: methyltransferase domain-containing protein [Planctomycetota bacterium]|nr:methyltransferase domain-containing protein [Planctomycetota bacterium]